MKPVRKNIVSAYTLIEIVVVIVVIAILATIGVYAYTSIAPNLKEEQAKSTLASISTAQQARFRSRGEFVAVNTGGSSGNNAATLSSLSETLSNPTGGFVAGDVEPTPGQVSMYKATWNGWIQLVVLVTETSDGKCLANITYDPNSGKAADELEWTKTSTCTAQTVALDKLGEETPTSDKPGTPTDLTGVGGPASAILSWSAGTGTTSAYQVYRCATGACDNTDIPGGDFTYVSAVISSTSFTDSGLTAGQTYKYLIVAVNSIGASDPTDPIAVVPADPSTQVPDRPTGLHAVSATDGSVQIEWNVSTKATAYRIYRDGTLLATTADASVVFTDDGTGRATPGNPAAPAAGAAYTYRVDAISPAGSSSIYTGVRVTIPPKAPTIGTVTALDSDSPECKNSATCTQISWTAPTYTGPPASAVPVSKYTVYRCEGNVTDCGPGNASAQIASNSTGTSFIDTKLAGSTVFSYAITATNDGGESPASSSSSVTTAASQVTGVAASPTAPGAITVTWDAKAGATGYRVYEIDSTGTRNTLHNVTGNGNTSWTETGLAGFSERTYQVAAVTAVGAGAPSESVTTVSGPAPLAAPTVVTTTTTATVYWTRATGVTYTVYRNGAVVASGLTGSSYVDTGLSPATSYTYSIRGTAASGYADSGTRAAVTLPTPVGEVTATTSGVTTTLSWAAVPGSVTYGVYRCTGSACTPSVQLGSAGSSTGYVDSTGVAGTFYTYSVVALNSENAASVHSSVVTTATIPTAVTSLTATSNPRDVTLNWSFPASGTATSFQIYRCNANVDGPSCNPDNPAFLVGSAAPVTGTSTATYVDTSIVGTDLYRYTVRAANSAGQAVGVTAVVGGSGPDAPTGFTVTAQTPDTGAARTNLLTNSSFESGITGWVNFTGGTASAASTPSAKSLAGTSVLRMTATAANATLRSSDWNETPILVTGNKTYTFSIKATSPNATQSVYATLIWKNATGANLGAPNTNTVTLTTSNTATLTYTGVAPVGATSVNIRLQSTSTAAGNIVDFDEAILEEGASAGPWFDGSSVSAWWNGTANNSTSSLPANTRYNLVTNPGFENGTGTWSVAGANIGTTTTSINGNSGATFTTTVNNGTTTLTGPPIPVTAAAQYTSSTFLKPEATVNPTTITYRINWYNTSGSLLSSNQATSIPTPGVWSRPNITATAPTNAVTAKIVIATTGSTTTNEQYTIDNNLFEPTNTLNNYFDGSFTGATWLGTPNESTSQFYGTGKTNTLDWSSAASGISNATFDIFRCLGTCSTDINNYTLIATGIAPGIRSYNDTTIVPLQTYTYTVRAVNGIRVGSPAIPQTIKVSLPAPTNFTVGTPTYTAPNYTSALSWDYVPGATGYIIRNDISNATIATTSGSHNTSTNLNTLFAGNEYALRVYAVTNVATPTDGTSTAATTLRTPLPAVATPTITARTTDTMTVAWTPLTNTGPVAVTYNVICSGPGCGTAQSNGSSYTFTGLTPNTNYSFTVTAQTTPVVTTITAPPSSPATAFTVANPPTGVNTVSTTLGRTNLATNPTFNTNTTGWTGTTRILTQNATGTTIAAGQFVGLNTLSYTYPTMTINNIIPGTVYTSSINVKADSAVTGTRHAYQRINYYNGSTYIDADISTPSSLSNSTWTTYKYTTPRPTPAGTTKIVVYYLVDTSGTGNIPDTEKYYVDSALFEEGSVAGTYFDGDTPGAAWTGTPNSSTSVYTQPTYTNLLKNPSFETDSGTWDNHGGAGLTSSSDYTYSGTNSLKVVTTPGNRLSLSSGYTTSVYRSPVTPGVPYSYSTYVRATAGSVMTGVSVYAYYYDTAGTLIGTGISGPSATLNTTDWTRITNTQIAPINAASTAMLIYQDSTVGGSTFYVDAAAITQTSTPIPYFDGSTGGANWNGTPNNSTSTLTTYANPQIGLTWNPVPNATSYTIYRNGIQTGTTTTTAYLDTATNILPPATATAGDLSGTTGVTSAGNTITVAPATGMNNTNAYTSTVTAIQTPGTALLAYPTTGTIPVTGNQRYAFSLRSRITTSGPTLTATANVLWYDTNGTYINTTTGPVVAVGTGWTQTAVHATAPNNAASASISYNLANAVASTMTFYADNLQFENNATATTFTPGNLDNGGNVNYTVTATTTAGETAQSTPPAVATLPPGPPSATAITSTYISNTLTNTLNWTAPTNGTPSGYRIYRCTGTTCLPNTPIITLTGTETTYADTAITPNTTYQYRIASTATTNAIVTAGRPALPVGILTLNATATWPTTSFTNITASSAQITWNIPAGATTHKLYRCTGTCTPAPGNQLSGWPKTIVNAGTYPDTGLTDNTKYTYAVESGNGTNYAPMSTSNAVTTSLLPPPFTVNYPTSTHNTITLSWATPNGATSYNVRLAASTNTGLVAAGSAVTANTALSTHTFTGLTPATNYVVSVTAVNEFSESAATAVGLKTRPSSPINLTGEPGPNKVRGKISLYWQAPTDGTLPPTGYKVYRQGNSITNPNLNTNTTGWNNLSGPETLTHVGTTGRNATGALQISPTTTGQGTWTSITTSTATKIFYTAWIYGPAGDYRIGSSQAAPSGGSNVQYSTPTTVSAGNGNVNTWIQLQGTRTVPAGETSTTVIVSSTTTSPWIVDDAAAYTYGFGLGTGNNNGTGAGSPTPICTTATISTVGTPLCNETGLSDATEYTYSVTAQTTTNAVDESATSTPVTISTISAPPAISTVNTSNTTTTLTWNAPTGTTSGYKLYRCVTDTTCTPSTNPDATWPKDITAGTLNYSDTSQAVNKTYYYQLTALTPGEESDPSTAVYTKTVPAPVTTPTTLWVGGVGVQISWTNPNPTTATGVNVYRCLGTTCIPGANLVATLSNTTTNWIDENTTTSTQYTYTIVATNAAGASATTSITYTTPPPPPEWDINSSTTNSVTLSWLTTANTSSYKLYRCVRAGTDATAGATNSVCEPSSSAAIATINAPTVTYTDTGRTDGVTYAYALSAISATDGTPSASLAYAVISTKPTPVTGVTFNATSATAATVSWTGKTAYPAGTVTYSVKYCAGSGCDPLIGTQVADTAATNVDITGLTPGQNYTAIVYTIFAGATSTSYATGSGITPIEDPTNLQANTTRTNLNVNPAPTTTTGWPTTWGGRPAGSIESTSTPGGLPSSALRINAATSSDSNATAMPNIVMNAGETYTYSVYVKAASGTPTVNLMRLGTNSTVTNESSCASHITTAPCATVSLTSTNRVDAGGGWWRLSRTFTVSTGGNYSMVITGQTNSLSSSIYVAGALIEKSATLGTYFDGSSNPANGGNASAWTGTANNSTSTLNNSASGGTNLTWSPVTGAANGYRVYRCNATAAITCDPVANVEATWPKTIASGTTAYTDTDTSAGNIYKYAVYAVGAANNTSLNGALLTPRVNYINNPAGTTASDWTATSGNLTSASGNLILTNTAGTAGTQGYIQTSAPDYIPTYTGRTLTLSADVRTPGTSVTLQLNGYAGTTLTTSPNQVFTVPSNTWTRIAYTWTPTSGITNVGSRIAFNNRALSQIDNVRNVLLENAPNNTYVPNYFDGNTGGATQPTWTGAANDSPSLYTSTTPTLPANNGTVLRPNVPTNVTTVVNQSSTVPSVTQNTVTSWTAPAGKIDGYSIYRCDGLNCNPLANPSGGFPVNTASLTYTDTSPPAANTTYSYAVVAYNSGGSSTSVRSVQIGTGEQVIVTPAVQPAAPTSVTNYNIASNFAQLNFAAPASAPAGATVRSQYQANGGTWTDLTPNTLNNISLPGFGTTYNLAVRTVLTFSGVDMPSAASPTLVFTTPPPAPTGLAVTFTRQTPTATWAAATSATSYNLYRTPTSNGIGSIQTEVRERTGVALNGALPAGQINNFNDNAATGTDVLGSTGPVGGTTTDTSTALPLPNLNGTGIFSNSTYSSGTTTADNDSSAASVTVELLPSHTYTYTATTSTTGAMIGYSFVSPTNGTRVAFTNPAPANGGKLSVTFTTPSASTGSTIPVRLLAFFNIGSSADFTALNITRGSTVSDPSRVGLTNQDSSITISSNPTNGCTNTITWCSADSNTNRSTEIYIPAGTPAGTLLYTLTGPAATYATGNNVVVSSGVKTLSGTVGLTPSIIQTNQTGVVTSSVNGTNVTANATAYGSMFATTTKAANSNRIGIQIKTSALTAASTWLQLDGVSSALGTAVPATYLAGTPEGGLAYTFKVAGASSTEGPKSAAVSATPWITSPVWTNVSNVSALPGAPLAQSGEQIVEAAPVPGAEDYAFSTCTSTTANTCNENTINEATAFIELSDVGTRFSCGLAVNTSTYCWGSNQYGQLGTTANSGSYSATPLQMETPLTFTKVATGDSHACGIATNNNTYCWGSNNYGQLGNTTNSGNSTANTTPLLVQGGYTFTSLDAGTYHVCGIAANSNTYCWGANRYGVLGNATNSSNYNPNNVPALVSGGQTFTAVSVGEASSCGLTGAGSVYCWGYNGYGQLGNTTNSGTLSTNSVPLLVQGGYNFSTISVGGLHACATVGLSSTYCWGSNRYGQLGNTTNSGTTNANNTPLLVQNSASFDTVKAGENHTCALRAAVPNSTVHCWGTNQYGQLGNTTNSGTTNTNNSPLLTTAPTFPVRPTGDSTWYTLTKTPGSTLRALTSTIQTDTTLNSVPTPSTNNALDNDRITTATTTPAFQSGLTEEQPYNDGAKLSNISNTQPNLQILRNGNPVKLTNATAYLATDTPENSYNLLPETIANTSSLAGIQGPNNPIHPSLNLTTGERPYPGATPNSGIRITPESEPVTNTVLASATTSLQGRTGNFTYTARYSPGTGLGTTDGVPLSVKAQILFRDAANAIVGTTTGTPIYIPATGTNTWQIVSATGNAPGTAVNATVQILTANNAFADGWWVTTINAGTTSNWMLANTNIVDTQWYAGTPTDNLLPLSTQTGAATTAEWTSAANVTTTTASTSLASWDANPNYTTIALNATKVTGDTLTQSNFTVAVNDLANVGYNFTGVVRSEAVGFSVYPTITWLNAAGVTLSTSRPGAPMKVAINWAPFNVSATPPQGATAARIGFTMGTVNDTAATATLGFTQIAAQGYSTCGLTISGAVYCWGYNQNGQTGSPNNSGAGINIPAPTPTLLGGGLTFTKLAAMHTAMCAISTNLNTYCWGSNQYGQLGNTTNSGSSTAVNNSPLLVQGGYQFVDLASGASFNHMCGRLASGAAYCWGINQFGQLGNTTNSGTTTPNNVPLLVQGGYEFAQLSAGGHQTCGLTTTGAAYCWGRNYESTLGNATNAGTENPNNAPLPVSGGRTYTYIYAGQYTTCGIATTTAIGYCWGHNSDGRLGIGTAGASTATPTQTMGGVALSTITAGNRQTCAVGLTNTRVWCTGWNNYGQLGSSTNAATNTNNPSPLEVTGTSVSENSFSSLTAGENHVCGIRRNTNSVYCWGNNWNGQLGTVNDGSYKDAGGAYWNPTIVYGTGPKQPEAAGTYSFASVQTSADHTCGLTPAGAAYCWGSNKFGQLGNATNSGTNNPNNIPLAVQGGYTFTTLVTPYQATCGIQSGTNLVYCWGSNQYGQLGRSTNVSTTTPNPTPATIAQGNVYSYYYDVTLTSLTAGTTHVCGMSGTSLWCWGYNYWGPVGTATNNSTATPITAPTSVAPPTNATWATVSAGESHTCALTTTGAAYCWGYNQQAQLGTTLNNVPNPTPIAVSGGNLFKSIKAASLFTCGITTSNITKCWGNNDHGQLGNSTGVGTSTYTSTPAPVSTTLTFTQLFAGTVSATMCALTDTAKLYCWGDNAKGQLGANEDGAGSATNSYWAAPTPIPVDTPIVAASVASGHACIISILGNVSCWGNDQYGQTGNSKTVKFTTIQTTKASACGLTPSGAAYCWGAGNWGSPGSDKISPSYVPAPVQGGYTFTSLIAGSDHMCGIAMDNNTYCWGYNGYGQLGNTTNSGTLNTNNVPLLVQGGYTFTSLTAGHYHTCGIATNNNTYCWGNNDYGQLGSTTSPGAHNVPLLVQGGYTFTKISAGNYYTCGIATNNNTYCWGRNDRGQLGNTTNSGTDTPNNAPLLVQGSYTFTKISAGGNHTCGVASNNNTYCWGYNASGQLGNTTNSGTVTPNNVPLLVQGGYTFTKITTGYYHTCGIATNNNTYCWGYNQYGQLGNTTNSGTATVNNVPLLVQGGHTFTSIAAPTAGYYTCGITTSNATLCWGQNNTGQFGDGTTSTSPNPTPTATKVPVVNATAITTVPLPTSTPTIHVDALRFADATTALSRNLNYQNATVDTTGQWSTFGGTSDPNTNLTFATLTPAPAITSTDTSANNGSTTATTVAYTWAQAYGSPAYRVQTQPGDPQQLTTGDSVLNLTTTSAGATSYTRVLPTNVCSSSNQIRTHVAAINAQGYSSLDGYNSNSGIRPVMCTPAGPAVTITGTSLANMQEVVNVDSSSYITNSQTGWQPQLRRQLSTGGTYLTAPLTTPDTKTTNVAKIQTTLQAPNTITSAGTWNYQTRNCNETGCSPWGTTTVYQPNHTATQLLNAVSTGATVTRTDLGPNTTPASIWSTASPSQNFTDASTNGANDAWYSPSFMNTSTSNGLNDRAGNVLYTSMPASNVRSTSSYAYFNGDGEYLNGGDGIVYGSADNSLHNVYVWKGYAGVPCIGFKDTSTGITRGVDLSPSRTNLATNPSFEYSVAAGAPGSWAAYTSAPAGASMSGSSISTVAAYPTPSSGGSNSLQLSATSMTSPASPESYAARNGVYTDAAVNPNTQYTLSANVTRLVGAGARVRVYADMYTSGFTTWIGRSSAAVSSTGIVSTTVTTPSDAALVRYYVWLEATPGTTVTNPVANVDAVLFENASTVGSYFDGNTSSPAAAQWSGTANVSTSVILPYGGIFGNPTNNKLASMSLATTSTGSTDIADRNSNKLFINGTQPAYDANCVNDVSRTNWVRNPSFETATGSGVPANWTTYSYGTVTTPAMSTVAANPTSGSNSLQVGAASLPSGSPAGGRYGVYTEIGGSFNPDFYSPSGNWTLSGNVTSLTGTNAHAVMYLEQYNGSNVVVASSNVQISSTGRFSTTLNNVANVGKLRAYLWVDSTSSTTVTATNPSATFDAIMLEQSSTAGTYFDGSTPDTAAATNSWDGTVNASASTQKINAIVPSFAAGNFTVGGTTSGTNPYLFRGGVYGVGVWNSDKSTEFTTGGLLTGATSGTYPNVNYSNYGMNGYRNRVLASSELYGYYPFIGTLASGNGLADASGNNHPLTASSNYNSNPVPSAIAGTSHWAATDIKPVKAIPSAGDATALGWGTQLPISAGASGNSATAGYFTGAKGKFGSTTTDALGSGLDWAWYSQNRVPRLSGSLGNTTAGANYELFAKFGTDNGLLLQFGGPNANTATPTGIFGAGNGYTRITKTSDTNLQVTTRPDGANTTISTVNCTTTAMNNGSVRMLSVATVGNGGFTLYMDGVALSCSPALGTFHANSGLFTSGLPLSIGGYEQGDVLSKTNYKIAGPTDTIYYEFVSYVAPDGVTTSPLSQSAMLSDFQSRNTP